MNNRSSIIRWCLFLGVVLFSCLWLYQCTTKAALKRGVVVGYTNLSTEDVKRTSVVTDFGTFVLDVEIRSEPDESVELRDETLLCWVVHDTCYKVIR